MKRAFTLIELLVVIAIIAILAAILFPVFAQAKQAAKKTVAISDFKQAGTAVAMYTSDVDGGYMMSNSGGNSSGWGYGPPDMVPGEQMAPYIKNTQINIDPMDPWQSETQRLNDQLPYEGATLANATAEQKAYALGVRSNIGYNYVFFSPWRYYSNGSKMICGSASTNEGMVGNPANTLMWGDSIWDRNSGGGPTGGGNWVIEAPCWLDTNGVALQPMKQYIDDGTIWSYGTGWTGSANDWLVYGGMWPFYNNKPVPGYAGLVDGFVVVGYADSHVQAKPIGYTTQGCSAYGQGTRRGTVTDKDKYIWDLE